MTRLVLCYTSSLVFFFCVHHLSGKNSYEVTEIPDEVRMRLNIDKFYVKHIDLHGFSIISSGKVSNYALKEAGFLIDKMVGNRRDLLSVLSRNKTRFVVMARDEFTTEIPEHSDLKPSNYWDRRARGLGATFARPAVSCGEENLLGLTGDPYLTENILIHEFAHALHQMALETNNSGFQTKIENCYRNSIERKIWEGTYASTNVNEYWAEGVQSWFNTNRENDPEHGSINTRKELKKADPKLAQLIKEIFGDSNWRYQLPQTRLPPSAHFNGYQPEKQKPFFWPEKLVQWDEDFKIGKVGLAPKGSPSISPLHPNNESVQRSQFSKKRNHLYFRNLSSKTIFLEWIDFNGDAKQKRTIRPKDHQEIFSFVGHTWQITHLDSKKKILRFILPKSQNSQFNYTNSSFK